MWVPFIDCLIITFNYYFSVRSVKNKSSYFAKRLHESMAGLGTNDRVLIRIVATRCEIDMVEIKNAYMSMYGRSLEADIAVLLVFYPLYLIISMHPLSKCREEFFATPVLY